RPAPGAIAADSALVHVHRSAIRVGYASALSGAASAAYGPRAPDGRVGPDGAVAQRRRAAIVDAAAEAASASGPSLRRVAVDSALAQRQRAAVVNASANAVRVGAAHGEVLVDPDLSGRQGAVVVEAPTQAVGASGTPTG